MTGKNASEMIYLHRPEYNFIRKLGLVFDNNVKAAIAGYTDVNTLIWRLDEFYSSTEAINIINTKLQNANLSLPYGVIIDKLFFARNNIKTSGRSSNYTSHSAGGGWCTGNNNSQTEIKINTSSPLYTTYNLLLKMAEDKLQDYKLTMNSKVAVFGDASSSMGVAIKTSSIITSILCTVCNADLHVFRNVNEHITDVPKNVKDVVAFNEKTHAKNATSPASSLDYYYSKGEPLDMIVIVTDEEENTKSSGMMFNEMFDKYCNKIGKVPKLVYISFLRQKKKGEFYDGQMTKEFRETYPKYSEFLYQYVFDTGAPDLTKLDTILNKLMDI